MRSASSARPCELDGTVGIAVAQFAFGFTHRFAGLAQLIEAVVALTLFALLTLLTLTVLADAALLKFVEQLVEAIAQRLLVLAQVVH